VDKHNRKFTKYVKSKTKSKTTIGPLITKEKKILTEGKEMAEELNKFFASVFTIEDMQNLPDPEPELVGHQMSTIKVSEQDIQRKICKLRKDAASGPDMLSPRLLQQLENYFLRPLSIIFNMSLVRHCTNSLENCNCDTDLQKRNQGRSGQLQTSISNKCPLQDTGVHHQG
jgi:hypothetical protein